MSDDFIPLNQSTPVQGMRQQGRNNFEQRSFQNRYQNGNQRRGGYNNRRGNRSYNSSYGSDNNSYNNDSTQQRQHDSRRCIDAYLHPSMLQDPWAKLRQRNSS